MVKIPEASAVRGWNVFMMCRDDIIRYWDVNVRADELCACILAEFGLCACILAEKMV